MSPNPHASRSLSHLANLEQQEKQARELLRAVNAHDPAAVQRIRDHHPLLAVKNECVAVRASSLAYVLNGLDTERRACGARELGCLVPICREQAGRRLGTERPKLSDHVA